MLPPPTVDSELMKRLTEEKDRVNPLFWSALDKFKPLIRKNLAPKHSYNHGEYVTGEGNIIRNQLKVQLAIFPKMLATRKATIENKSPKVNETAKVPHKKNGYFNKIANFAKIPRHSRRNPTK